MNQYCYTFQNSNDVLNSLTNFSLSDTRSVEKYNKSSGLIKDSFLEKLNRIAPIYIIKVFHSPPNFVSKIHTDVDQQKKLMLYAINFILTPDHPGLMEWYNVKERKMPIMNPDGAYSNNYGTDDIIDLSYKAVISTTPSLIRIDEPHRVVADNGPRTSISIRCHHSFSSWEEVVTAYSQAGF